MIHTAKQLKDKVKNLSGGNSDVAQALIRNFIMERFLERVLEKMQADLGLAEMWGRFKDACYFVGEIDWEIVVRFDAEWISKIASSS